MSNPGFDSDVRLACVIQRPTPRNKRAPCGHARVEDKECAPAQMYCPACDDYTDMDSPLVYADTAKGNRA